MGLRAHKRQHWLGWLWVVIGVTGLSTCSNPSGPRAGINIVSGGGLTDTALSIFKPPLTVQLLDGDLHPVPGQTVYFNTNGFVLVAWLDEPGFVTNRKPVTTDSNGYAAVLVEAKQWAATGKVVVVPPSGPSVDVYYTVLPGAPARVRADPSDTALYVGGSVTFRPYITDAYTNRLQATPTYQYQSVNSALTISAPGKATGAAIGRGAVAVTALGFTDTMWASVVPKGRLAAQGDHIVVMNLDGSAYDTIPSPWNGGSSLDWSAVSGTFVYAVNASDYRDLISQDMMGHAHPIVTDPLMRGELYPRYAHDGSYIYFTGIDTLSTCWGVWRIHPGGTALEHVVADTTDCGIYAYTEAPAPNHASSPSPDGTRLVYVGGQPNSQLNWTLSHQLRVRTLATGADTSLGVAGNAPRWSPTGEWIAYDYTGTLMLIHPDGTGQQSLFDRGDYGDYPAVSWSPDGQWLICYSFNAYGSPDKPTGFSGFKIVQIATGLRLPLPFAGDLRDPTWQP